ncbi:MAG: hypothetical protein ACRETG_06525 [Steroidobacteraceae bacterium]
MSWRLWKPRPIASYEARIVRRVLELGADADYLPSAAMLDSIERLIVQEEGDGGANYDSLEFGCPHGSIIAMALGTMTNDAPIELFLWARGEIITYLELEPFNGTRLPIRMPLLESIRPYPADPYGIEEEGESAALCTARGTSDCTLV